MRGWAAIPLAAWIAGMMPATAAAESPAELLKRVLEPRLQQLGILEKPAVPKPKLAQPADTPLLAVPLPHLRPDGAGVDPALGFLPDAATATIVVPTDEWTAPMPRLRNRAAEPGEPEWAAVPPDENSEPLVPLSELIEPEPAAQSTCGVSLAMLGVTAIPLEAIDQGACGMSAPVEVAALDGGAIDVRGNAVVNCTMAETFAGWIEETVEPMAKKMLDGTITSVRVVAGYDCRSRNGVAGAQLSEHGKGNAIDIAAFEIEGRGWIEVGKADGAARSFLEEVRKSACGPFKTVLGPGSDAYHSDHLHIDLAQRRNGGTYCR
jgi:hypothetical protein